MVLDLSGLALRDGKGTKIASSASLQLTEKDVACVHENVTIGRTDLVSASTNGLHEREKFDFWHEAVGKAVVDLECEPSDRLTFNASVTGVAMESISVVRIAASPHRVSRNPKSHSDNNDSLVLNFLVSGRMIAEQDGRETLLLPGDGAICVAERPYVLRFDEAFEVVTVRLPRACVARPSAVERSTAVGFSKAGHLARIMRSGLAGVA
jgi:AraC family transcriptional activator of tynA and feaB